MYTHFQKNILNNLNLKKSKSPSPFLKITKRGIKMQQLHFYTGSGFGTPSGLKVCVFGATSNMGYRIAANLFQSGVPMVLCHRGPLDYLCPPGDDPVYTRSNPYYTSPPFFLGFDNINVGLMQTRIWSELGMRYYQHVVDLTNEFDIENGIKDCDVVINLVGEKQLNKYDSDYEVPNVIIPREIAKVCAKKKVDGKVKRLIHFSAAGCNPDAISRRLRSKWKGEQEVKKYFPEATIIRPTSILADTNDKNFVGYYIHCWLNNNGTVLLLDDGRCIRQPVQDKDIALAIYNMLQLDDSVGSTYELGGPHQYTMKELMEFFSNALNHRPRFVNVTFEDFMKLYLAPNLHFEKAVNYIIARPDLSAELRTDIIVNKREGVKTFEDLHILPVSTHHILTDWGNFFLERQNPEMHTQKDHDEDDVDDDAHH